MEVDADSSHGQIGGNIYFALGDMKKRPLLIAEKEEQKNLKSSVRFNDRDDLSNAMDCDDYFEVTLKQPEADARRIGNRLAPGVFNHSAILTVPWRVA
eukprot:SAG11_NODE_1703_length_4420_cov_1.855589_3_plen_98_part_00